MSGKSTALLHHPPIRRMVRGRAAHGPTHRIDTRHEEDRLSFVRTLDALAAIADALGRGRAAAIDRPRRRRRGAGRGRRLFPRPSLRPPARFALSAAGGGRREDEPHRDRHGRHRHALREPALHGRGRRRRRSDRRRPAAARHQPRLARAGDRWLALFRLSRPPRARATPTWAAATPKSSSTCCAARALREPNPRPMFPESARPAAPRAALRRPARADLVGRRLERHRGVGGQARHEPAELDAEERRDRRALPRPAGRADPRLPRGLEGGRPRARAARLGQPQHLRADRRSRPRLFRPRRRERGPDRLHRPAARARSSAAAMPPSRMC